MKDVLVILNTTAVFMIMMMVRLFYPLKKMSASSLLSIHQYFRVLVCSSTER